MGRRNTDARPGSFTARLCFQGVAFTQTALEMNIYDKITPYLYIPLQIHMVGLILGVLLAVEEVLPLVCELSDIDVESLIQWLGN